jgi:hypothetical protein
LESANQFAGGYPALEDLRISSTDDRGAFAAPDEAAFLRGKLDLCLEGMVMA